MEAEVLLSSAESGGFERVDEGPLDISRLDLYELLRLFIMLLSEQAWRHMGLRVDPAINEIEKDFMKAHIAIDCIISLVEKMEQHLSTKEKDSFRNLITDLQINYAQQASAKT